MLVLKLSLDAADFISNGTFTASILLAVSKSSTYAGRPLPYLPCLPEAALLVAPASALDWAAVSTFLSLDTVPEPEPVGI